MTVPFVCCHAIAYIFSQLSAQVYGFVAWVFTCMAFVLFVVWAYSDQQLEAWGVPYFPDRQWAISVPAYLLVVAFCVNAGYHGVNLLSIAPLDSFDTIRDRHTRLVSDCTISSGGQQQGGVPVIEDLDISTVNELVYLRTPNAPGSDQKGTQSR